MSGDTWHDHVDSTWHPKGVTHVMSHVVHLCEWLTLSHVSKEGNKGKINQEIKRKNGSDDKWQWKKVGGSFPHFWNIRLMQSK